MGSYGNRTGMGVEMNKQLELFPNLKFTKPKVSELKKMILYKRIEEVVENVKKETL